MEPTKPPELKLFTARMRLQWEINTGFGHRPGMKIQMSDRTYVVDRSGSYRRLRMKKRRSV